MKDLQMRVRPPENGGSPGDDRPPENVRFAGARSPARKWGIRRSAFARPKTEESQVRVRRPENARSAGAH